MGKNVEGRPPKPSPLVGRRIRKIRWTTEGKLKSEG